MAALNANCVHLHVRERGSGEAVLLLHSAGNTGAQWTALGDALGDGFRLLAPDLYDCGATSAWTRDHEMSYDDVALLLTPLLLQNSPLHLVGHSFGGGVALRLAAAHPQCLRTLTLIEPGAYQLLQEASRANLWLDFLQVMDDFTRTTAEGDPGTAWAMYFDTYCSHVGAWHTLPATMREAILQKTPVQLRVYGAQVSNPTRLSHIRALTCPTLVIHGQKSRQPEQVICKLIAANAPLGRISEVPEAGHMVPLTHAQGVAELLRTLFGQHGI